MCPLLSPSSSFRLKAGQVQALQAFGVQPNHWQAGQEAEETPVSTKVSGNADRTGAFQGAPGCPLACGA